MAGILALVAGPAAAVCPIPVFVDDSSKHQATRDDTQSVFGNLAELQQAYELSKNTALLLGATDPEKGNQPDSQNVSFLPEVVHEQLPPHEKDILDRQNSWQTNYAPSGGSSPRDRIADIRRDSRDGIRNEVDRHQQGLNDWNYWEEAGPDPRRLAEERARALTDKVEDARLRAATAIPDSSPILEKAVEDAELRVATGNPAHCELADRNNLFGPNGVLSRVLQDPRQAPKELAGDILSGKLDIGVLSPAQIRALTEILQNPEMTPERLVFLLGQLPPELADALISGLENVGGGLVRVPAALAWQIADALKQHVAVLPQELKDYISQLELAKLGHIKLPDFPHIHFPDVDFPHIHLPNIHFPDLHLPDIDLPDFNLPGIDLPHISLPDINFPDMPNISDDLKKVLKAIRDPTNELRKQLSPHLKKVAYYLEHPEELKKMAQAEFQMLIDSLPPELHQIIEIARDPKQFALDQIPPDVFTFLEHAARLKKIKDNPELLLTPDMVSMIQLIRDPTLAYRRYVPYEYRRIINLIFSIRSLKDLFDRIQLHPDFPQFLRLALQDPEAFFRNQMTNYALQQAGNAWADSCQPVTPDTGIVEAGNRRPDPVSDSSEFEPSPVVTETKSVPSPARATDVEAETRKRLPAATPMHGAPLPGGFSTGQAYSVYQYESIERSMTAAGLNGPDYDIPNAKPASILAAYSCPEDGWSHAREAEQPVTQDGLPPSTSGLVAPTDVLWAGKGTYDHDTGAWQAKHIPEARQTYLINTALDSWALQAASRANEKLKNMERNAIFEAMQTCGDLNCEFKHFFMLKLHLLELEAETARLELGLLGLETAAALDGDNTYLP